MSLLDDVGLVLQNNAIGILGVDLFLGMRPDTPDVCVAVMETQGLEPIEGYGAQPMDYLIDRPSAQFVARAFDYVSAVNKAVAAYKVLHGFHGLVNGVNYLAMRAAQPPFRIGTDQNDRFLVGFNLNFLKAPPP